MVMGRRIESDTCCQFLQSDQNIDSQYGVPAGVLGMTVSGVGCFASRFSVARERDRPYQSSHELIVVGKNSISNLWC